MSQIPSKSPAGGKASREKRRLSSDQPYKRPRTSSSNMPATRRSPARPHVDHEPDEPVPLASIMQEFALLRKAMETRFSEADKKSDSLRGELVGKLDANDKAVSDLQIAVTEVTLSVDDNQRAIHEVRAEVERREVELPGKVRAIVQEALERSRDDRPARGSQNGPRHRPLGGSLPLAETAVALPEPAARVHGNDEAYDLARRSLRLWPVSKEGDLLVRTREFLVNELLLDQQYVIGINFKVRTTAGQARGKEKDQAASRVKDEVLVVFDTIRERDEVRGHARNLEKKGRGLRLEVPDHLWPSFRTLQDLAYELKQKNPALRRNVLYDDLTRDLRLDFSTGENEWKSVTPSEARKSLRACRPARTRKSSVSATELEQLLGSRQDSNMSVSEEY